MIDKNNSPLERCGLLQVMSRASTVKNRERWVDNPIGQEKSRLWALIGSGRRSTGETTNGW